MTEEGEERVGTHLEVSLPRHEDAAVGYGMAMRKNGKVCFHAQVAER